MPRLRKVIFFVGLVISIVGLAVTSKATILTPEQQQAFMASVRTGADALPPAGTFREDELIIRDIGRQVSSPGLKKILKKHRAFIAHDSGIGIKKIKVSPDNIHQIKSALEKEGLTGGVEYNHIITAHYTPEDNYYSKEWFLPDISAPQGWDITRGDSQIIIAVLDTGVDSTHPDLEGKVLPGYNFYNNTSDTADTNGHGTAVAGAAAAADASLGVAGVALNCSILPVVIAGPNGTSDYYTLARGIQYAADHGARVINISYGGTFFSQALQDAVNYAWSKGALVVASAGNSSTDTLTYPAAATNVIAVSAIDQNDKPTSFTNYGPWIDVAAPGQNILSTWPDHRLAFVSGTSFSSPITAGLLALVFSVNPNLSNTDAVNLLLHNSDELGSKGFDNYYGYGKINVYKTLQAAVGTLANAVVPPAPAQDITPPDVSFTSPTPTNGSAVKGTITLAVSATDNVGVVKVEIYVDGALKETYQTAPYQLPLNTSTLANGTHTFIAKAYNAAGKSTSSMIALRINNNRIRHHRW